MGNFTFKLSDVNIDQHFIEEYSRCKSNELMETIMFWKEKLDAAPVFSRELFDEVFKSCFILSSLMKSLRFLEIL